MKWNRLLTILGRLAIVILSVGALGWLWMHSGELWHARTPTAATWIAQAQSGNADQRRYAVSELGSAHPIDLLTVAPALIGALNDREAAVRNEAALALWRYLAETLKARGSSMINELRAAAVSLIEVVKQDGDNGVRTSAAFAAASLVRELKDAGVELGHSSADDPIDPRTLVKVISAVLERDPAARLGLLVAIRRLGPIDEPAPPRFWLPSTIRHESSASRPSRRLQSLPAGSTGRFPSCSATRNPRRPSPGSRTGRTSFRCARPPSGCNPRPPSFRA